MREVLSVLKAPDKPTHTKEAVGACKRYVIGMPYEEGGQPKVMRFGVQITDRYLLSSAAQNFNQFTCKTSCTCIRYCYLSLRKHPTSNRFVDLCIYQLVTQLTNALYFLDLVEKAVAVNKYNSKHVMKTKRNTGLNK